MANQPPQHDAPSPSLNQDILNLIHWSKVCGFGIYVSYNAFSGLHDDLFSPSSLLLKQSAVLVQEAHLLGMLPRRSIGVLEITKRRFWC